MPPWCSQGFSATLIACASFLMISSVNATESWTSFAPPSHNTPSTESTTIEGDLPWKSGSSFSDNTFQLRYAPSSETVKGSETITSKPKRVAVNPWKPTSRWNNHGSYTTNVRPWGNVPDEKPDRNKKKSQEVTFEQWNAYPEYQSNGDPFLSNGGYGMHNVGLTSVLFTSTVVTPTLYPGGLYDYSLYPATYPGGLYGPVLYNNHYPYSYGYPYPGLGRLGHYGRLGRWWY